MANFAGPNIVAHDLLATKTNFVLRDFTANGGVNWFGPDMVPKAAETSVALFDGHPYDHIMLSFSAAITGGTAPSIQWSIVAYDINDQENGMAIGACYVATTGGPCVILSGSGAPSATTGDQFLTTPHVFTPMVPAFFRVRANLAGAPNGIAGARLFIYGML